MNDLTKAAAIVAVSIMTATVLWIYFSPYHTCVRAEYRNDRAELNCAAALGRR